MAADPEAGSGAGSDAGSDPLVRRFTDPGTGLAWAARRFEPTLGGVPSAGAAGAGLLSDGHARGWLTFECETTGWLRRLVPAPDDWSSCDEARLLEHFGAARRVPRRKRSGPLP